MPLTEQELDFLRVNSLSVKNARELAEFIESDDTVGGIFPNGAAGDFTTFNAEAFKKKWCSWYPIARILLKIAKAFAGPKGDEKIDAIIEIGDSLCLKPSDN